MNSKINYKHLALIVVLLMAGWYLGYREGKHVGREEYVMSLEDNLMVSECDGNGCYVAMPDAYSVYAQCQKDYSCVSSALTKEGKEFQRTQDEMFRNLMKEMPQ